MQLLSKSHVYYSPASVKKFIPVVRVQADTEYAFFKSKCKLLVTELSGGTALAERPATE